MAQNPTYDTTSRSRNILIHPGETPDNKPGVHINQDTVVMYSPEGTRAVSVTREDGVSLAGPLTIQTMPDQCRFAGLWTIHPLTLTALPSTIYTPIPWLKQDIPRPSQTLVEGLTSVMSAITGIIG